MRLAVAALLILGALPAAAEHLPQLSLAGAQAVFGPALRAGTRFEIGPYRFVIKHAEAKSPRPGVFIVEIETEPVP